MVRLTGFALTLLFAGTASGATVQDHRCLTGGRNDSIHLEWRWLDDGAADVRYAGQRGGPACFMPIPAA